VQGSKIAVTKTKLDKYDELIEKLGTREREI